MEGTKLRNFINSSLVDMV